MGVIPNTRMGRIEFYEAHLQAWADHAAAIGLDPDAVLEFQSSIADARTGFLDAETAREAAKAATQTFYNKAEAMAVIGSNFMRTIRNHALASSDPDVYALAQIPAPARPAPVAAPGQPYAFTVTLAATGSLELRWKCSNPAGAIGTVYEIQRRIGTGPFEYVGIPGQRVFEDTTIPAGTPNIVYQITALRSTTRGTPARFLVNFGSGTSTSGLSAQPVTADPITLAA